MITRKNTLPFLVLLFITQYTLAEDIFVGKPITKISENGVSRFSENLGEETAKDLKCIITQEGDRFFWASRENIELIPHVSGAFTTYVALNGSGFVRVINKDFKDIVSKIRVTEYNFDYVEYLLLGLQSVTYFGISVKQY